MIQRVLAPYSERVFFVLRVIYGLMFAMHGMQKVLGILADHAVPVGSQLWIGGIIELTTGLAIAVGLFTSWAAFLASGMMAVAYMQFHWKFQMGGAFFPVVNKGELAVMYCFAYLYLACRGAGPFSLDAKLRAGRG
ncbi:DoxX family protein [Pendulispora albinea]|uniref:DoxX family protein n=1 Tax=Pendulispora albinea TaxID=2741071 RepID=A0ABZ2LVH6_9BACT